MKISNKKGFSIWADVFILATAIIMFILISLNIASTKKEINNEYFKDKTYKIYSIEKDKKTIGDFVLGNGYINSKPVYYAYIEKENKEGEKGYRLKELPGNSIIIEFKKDSLTTPHVKERSYNCKENILIGKQCKKETTIFVPENSIIKKFTPPTESAGN